MKGTVFLGAGRITSALIAGLRLAHYRSPIVVHDHHPQNMRSLKRAFSVITESDLQKAVGLARHLIIAVRPDSVRELLQRIEPVQEPVIAISLAAGIPLAALRKHLGPLASWSRAMPSPAARFRYGLTAVTFSRKSSKLLRDDVHDLFGNVGQVIEIPESRLDAFTVTYSCSHGYHALSTLASAAGKLGLDRKTAMLAAAHALADGILSWRRGNIRLPDLLVEAATPGGIAATTLSAMNDAGYDHAVEKGMRAGFARTRENAKRFSARSKS